MQKWFLIACLAALVVGCHSTQPKREGKTAATAAQTSSRKPNILLLFADDLGWTDIHTGVTSNGHGTDYVDTPTIDKLATQGVSFTNMHAAPNCAPSRAALMTGQYAIHNGVYNVGSLDRGTGKLKPADQHGEHISNDAITLAETLHTAGYTTCHVGKYHVSKHDDVTKYDGFDVNYGGGQKGDGGPKGYFARNVDDGWTFTNLGPEMNAFAAPYTQEYIDKNLKPFANGNDPSSLVGTPKHLTDADADAAIDFMSKHLASDDKDKPFFMNVAYNAVHTAIIPRPDLLKKYAGHPVGDTRQNKPEFAGLTEGVDQSMARILKFVDDSGLADNTLVIFTSDNGGSGARGRNVPLRAAKGTFYEGGLRVPMIARLPGVTKSNSTTDAMISIIDLYPTFADFAGAKLPDPSKHALDGKSFAKVIRGQSKDSDRTVTYYHFPGYLDTRAFPLSIIVKRVGSDDYKLIYSYEDQHFELYNNTKDLEEKHDLLAGKPADKDIEIATDLRDDLHGWLTKNHPLMAMDKATSEPVPTPITVDAALKAGNKATRVMGDGGDD